MSSKDLATLLSRIRTPNSHPLLPQEPHLLVNSSQTEQETGKVEPVPVKIQSQTHPCPQIADGTK